MALFLFIGQSELVKPEALATHKLEVDGDPGAALTLLHAIRDQSPTRSRLEAFAHRASTQAIFDKLSHAPATRHAIAAHFHFAAGRDREAYLFARRALRLSPGLPQLHGLLANVYRRTGHPDWAATEAWREKILEDSAPPSESYKRALEHLESEQRAIDELMQFADCSEQCWEKFDVQATVARQRGDANAALAFAQKAVELAPGNPSAERGLALARFVARQFEAALPLLEKYQMPERAVALLELGEPAKASEIPLSGDPYENAKLLGRIHIELNKPMLGIPTMQAQTQLDVDGSLHEILGKAYQALHQPPLLDLLCGARVN